MPFCPKCGKEVSPEASYCPSCGANLKVDKDLLREKIAETRHNETGASITCILGFIVLLAALYVASIKATRHEWVGLTLYEVTYSPYADIAIVLAVLGGILLFIGAALSIYFYYERHKLMKQLEALK